MFNYKIASVVVTTAITASLSLTSLLAEEPDAWPKKLPASVTKLIQTERPKPSKETGLSNQFGLELLTKTLKPNTSLKSGIVLIKREHFLPKRLHAGRVPLVKIRLFFDTRSKPALWAQWTDTSEKQCAFIRGQNASYLSEQFPNRSSRLRIHKYKVDYIPNTKYCDLFPLLSFNYLPHLLMDPPETGESFVKHALKVGINAVEKEGEEHYLVHQVVESTYPKSQYSKYHSAWWITSKEPFFVTKMVAWGRLRESEEWRVITALQNEFEEREGIKVPKVYESYQYSQKYDEKRVERISFSWKDVNAPLPPELFNEDLLEPQANTILYDRRDKDKKVIDVPYGSPKTKKSTPK